jgi:hypothetical protein
MGHYCKDGCRPRPVPRAEGAAGYGARPAARWRRGVDAARRANERAELLKNLAKARAANMDQEVVGALNAASTTIASSKN